MASASTNTLQVAEREASSSDWGLPSQQSLGNSSVDLQRCHSQSTSQPDPMHNQHPSIQRHEDDQRASPQHQAAMSMPPGLSFSVSFIAANLPVCYCHLPCAIGSRNNSEQSATQSPLCLEAPQLLCQAAPCSYLSFACPLDILSQGIVCPHSPIATWSCVGA